MRSDLISRLRTAEINCDDIPLKNLLAEAANKIEEFQREKDRGYTLSGCGVMNKLKAINDERAEKGLPPI